MFLLRREKRRGAEFGVLLGPLQDCDLRKHAGHNPQIASGHCSGNDPEIHPKSSTGGGKKGRSRRDHGFGHRRT